MATPTAIWSTLPLIVFHLFSNCVTGESIGHRPGLEKQDYDFATDRRLKLTVADEKATSYTGQGIQKRSPENELNLSLPGEDSLHVDTTQDTFVHPVADFILRVIRNQIIKRGKQQISIPEIHKSKKQSIGPLNLTLRLDATEGWFSDLSSIRRVGKVDFTRSKNEIIMKIGVGLDKMTLGYDKYEIQLGPLSIDGRIGGDVQNSSITTTFTIDVGNNSCRITLLETKVGLLGKLTLQATGLGKLNWLFSKVLSWIANMYREDVQPRVEMILHDNIQNVFERVRCDEF